MNDRSEREAVRMLKKLHDRVGDLEESDRSGDAPRLLRSVSEFSADADVVSLETGEPQVADETSADSETVTMTSSLNTAGLWGSTNWSTSTWQ